MSLTLCDMSYVTYMPFMCKTDAVEGFVECQSLKHRATDQADLFDKLKVRSLYPTLYRSPLLTLLGLCPYVHYEDHFS